MRTFEEISYTDEASITRNKELLVIRAINYCLAHLYEVTSFKWSQVLCNKTVTLEVKYSITNPKFPSSTGIINLVKSMLEEL